MVQFWNELWVTCCREKVNVHSMIALLLFVPYQKIVFDIKSCIRKLFWQKNVQFHGLKPLNMVKESSTSFWFVKLATNCIL